MIDTIFYFAKKMDDYRAAVANGNVSSKTIVFVEDVQEIYLNGVGYGKTSTVGLLPEDEYNTWKETILTRITNLANDAAEANEALVERWKSELADLASQLQGRIEEINNSTDTTLDTIRTEVQDDILSAIDLATEHMISDNESQWSNLVTDVNGIKGWTNKIDFNFDSNGNIVTSNALLSIIASGIQNDSAFTNLSNRWAVLDDDLDVLEWLASGFKSQASQGGTFAQIYSASQDAIANLQTSVNGDGTQANVGLVARVNAIDGLDGSLATILAQSNADHSKIEAITSVGDNNTTIFNESKLDSAITGLLAENSNSNAKTLILGIASDEAAKIDITTAIGNATSGFASQAYVDNAINNLSANIKDEDGHIITSASLREDVDRNSAMLSAIGTYNDETGEISYSGGILTESDMKGAFTAMFASGTERNNLLNAAIVAAVNDEGSNIYLSADKINLDGDVIASRLTAKAAQIGGFTINQDSLSATTGSGNYVNRTRLTESYILFSSQYHPVSSTVYNTDYTKLSPEGLHGYTEYSDDSNATVTTTNHFKFNKDGSGYLANSAISWDSDGNLSVNGGIRSAFVNVLDGSTFTATASDNINIYSTTQNSDNTCNIPWDATLSGRRITIANYKTRVPGSGALLATYYVAGGSTTIPAPSGKYFFEDGILKSSLKLSREFVELIGYGDKDEFYGWVVVKRVDLVTTYKYGHPMKMLAWGRVTGTSSGADILYNSFDGSTLAVTREETGIYTISWTSSWYLDASSVFAMVCGFGVVAGNNPAHASVKAQTRTSVSVLVSDDDSRNDGSFNFILMNFNDWMFLN